MAVRTTATGPLLHRGMPRWTLPTLGIVLVLLLLAAGIGIGRTTSKENISPPMGQSPTNVQAPAAVAPPDRPTNQTRIGPLLMTVNSIRFLENERPAESWMRYVAVNLTVQNIGDSVYNLGFLDFKLVDNDREVNNQEIDFLPFSDYGTSTCGSCLVPGKDVRATLVFKILKETTPVSLEYRSKLTDVSGIIPLT